MNILLIAGHGQGDPGAVGNGYKEAELVREIATSLKSKLSAYANVDLFDTSKNMYKYLKAGNTFNFKNYDYVFEIHFNAAAQDFKGNGKTTGTEIHVHTSEKGTTVEKAIVNNISALGFKSRGVKTRSDLQNMNVCKKRQGVSYALLETCFIDDKDDMKLYSAKKDAVITAIANGIISGFNLGIVSTEKKAEPIKELTTPNDIVWELSQRIEITNVPKAVSDLTKAMDENSSCYWMLKKIANKR